MSPHTARFDHHTARFNRRSTHFDRHTARFNRRSTHFDHHTARFDRHTACFDRRMAAIFGKKFGKVAKDGGFCVGKAAKIR